MHPILADRKRLVLYLLVWLLLAFLLALLTMEPGRFSFGSAFLLTAPPTLLYAFFCLAAWYPTRAMPPRAARIAQLLATHLFGALVLSGIWVFLFRSWARLLDEVKGGDMDTRIAIARSFVLVVTGALLYLLSIAFHYLLIALAQAHEIERRESEVRILAREAELKALKAQLDPHFLFNSLNSISSLCGSSPASARTLTTLLAEYLRKSLRFGGAETITLSEELELASSYLAIERIRFGARLEFEQIIDEQVRMLRVPPLLLQPLVENAVTHGIGSLVDGGVVKIEATGDDASVRIAVENPFDPDAAGRPGEGIGLANTKRRIAAFHDEARIEITRAPAHFRVTLVLPR
jgi:sensor histidine kinase YesM